MTAQNAAPKLTMLGSPDASACEGDACLVPGAELPGDGSDAEKESRASCGTSLRPW